MDDIYRRPWPSRSRMVLRAFTLRCPRCGGRGIWRTWFKMKHACPTCGLVDKRNRLSQAQFVCVGCGLAGHADTIAALNS